VCITTRQIWSEENPSAFLFNTFPVIACKARFLPAYFRIRHQTLPLSSTVHSRLLSFGQWPIPMAGGVGGQIGRGSWTIETNGRRPSPTTADCLTDERRPCNFTLTYVHVYQGYTVLFGVVLGRVDACTHTHTHMRARTHTYTHTHTRARSHKHQICTTGQVWTFNPNNSRQVIGGLRNRPVKYHPHIEVARRQSVLFRESLCPNTTFGLKKIPLFQGLDLLAAKTVQPGQTPRTHYTIITKIQSGQAFRRHEHT
jgi:hypothetical protein